MKLVSRLIYALAFTLSLCAISPVFADATPLTQVTDSKYDKVKIRRGLESILWYGAGLPLEFDPSKLSLEEASDLESKGLELAEKVANAGSSTYQADLADYYYLNKKDYRKAVYWAEKAALQGKDRAMQILSLAYLEGNGVLEDCVEGFKWTHLAAAAGNEDCKELLNEWAETYPDFYQKGYLHAKDWLELHKETFYRP